MFYRFSVFLFFLIISLASNAKINSETLAPRTVRGYVYDSLALEPMEYASVALLNAGSDTPITGVITDINGFFRITDVEPGSYIIEISFIGYENKRTEVFELTSQQNRIDLGRILVSPSQETLEEVRVTANRPTMTYRIDKKVINVSQEHTSASGTAIEVLENIPSVTVSIEGDVSLRGSSNFTVLIDGKPTILDASDLLNQIPASQIENIEIITNPSARYDPDGVTGIINIVMKQQRLQGFNGVVNANIGTKNRYGGDFLVDYRKERFNFYLGADYNQRGMNGQSNTQNESYGIDTTFLYSQGDFLRQGNSWGIRTGVDFNINPENTLSLAYRMGERERGGESERFYEEWTSQEPERENYTSFEEGERGGNSQTFTLDYIKKFDQEDHEIIAQAIVSTRDSEDNSLNQLFNDQNQVTQGQLATEKGPGSRYTFKLDYTLPIGEHRRLESGYQSRISESKEFYTFSEYNTETAEFVADPLFSREVEYLNSIHSLYTTFSGEINDFGFQAGLRGEYTDRLVNLIGQNIDFPITRWDLYPTLHFSYNMQSEQQIMASYTRRLQRLRGWYLEPFYTWSDAFNIRIGNPDLNPEYIDSYEISYQNRFEQNVFSVDLYYRVTNNKIERIRSIYDNQPNVFLTTFANVGKDYSLGTELMVGFDPTEWWHVDIMGNIYNYRQEGNFSGQDFSASSFNWNTRVNNDFNITPSTRLQLRGMYNSPTITAQGERSGYFITNLSVRQDFMERALSATLQVRDLFSSLARESTVIGEDFYTFNEWSPDTPIISLTLSYRINNNRAGRRLPEIDNERGNGEEGF